MELQLQEKRALRLPQLTLHIVIIALLLIMLYPLAFTLWGAFKSAFIFNQTKWYPTLPIRVTNLAVAWPNIWRYILNTVIVAGAGTLGCLFISTLSAYAFAKMQFVGRNVLYFMVIALMMIPGILTLVPSYMIYKSVIGLNNYMILIIPIIFGGAVFGVFLLRAFFDGLPEAIFESARIDGAKEYTVFSKICVPMSMPIVGTLAIMQIVGTWNEFMWPMITIQDDHLLTLSAGLLMRFSSVTSTNYPVLFSGYLLASLPLILLFIFANKAYVEGLTSSGLKL